MIEQCQKCALYNSLGCPYNLELAEKFSDCDEFRPREEVETKLKPCPFCGGNAEVKKGKSYYVDCFYTHCTKCGVSTPKIPINHLFYTKAKTVRLTEEQAKKRTTNDWNRRASIREVSE